MNDKWCKGFKFISFLKIIFLDLIIEKDNDSVLLKLFWKILDELNLFMKKIMCIVMKDIINICDIRK